MTYARARALPGSFTRAVLRRQIACETEVGFRKDMDRVLARSEPSGPTSAALTLSAATPLDGVLMVAEQ
jgi:hypothetical protein